MDADVGSPASNREDSHMLLHIDEHCSDAEDHFQRDRGGLTQTDKEFLCRSISEREDMDDEYRRNTRYRIRQRIINTLLDLVFVGQRLENRDLALIFNELAQNHDEDVSTEVFHLFYRGVKVSNPDLDVETFLEEALSSAKEREEGIEDDEHVHIDVDLDANVTLITEEHRPLDL